MSELAQTRAVPLAKLPKLAVVLHDGAEYKVWKHVRVIKPGGTMLLASPRTPEGSWAVQAVGLYYANDKAEAELVVHPR